MAIATPALVGTAAQLKCPCTLDPRSALVLVTKLDSKYPGKDTGQGTGATCRCAGIGPPTARTRAPPHPVPPAALAGGG